MPTLDKEKRSLSPSLRANICEQLQVFSVSNWGHLCLMSVSGLQVQLVLTLSYRKHSYELEHGWWSPRYNDLQTDKQEEVWGWG
jgi:hypothetical protein